jgi:hypothetical protein
MSVEVTAAGSAFQTGAAQRLFESPAAGFGTWDVSADGKRFLIAARAAAGAPAPLPYHVVLNWLGCCGAGYPACSQDWLPHFRI